MCGPLVAVLHIIAHVLVRNICSTCTNTYTQLQLQATPNKPFGCGLVQTRGPLVAGHLLAFEFGSQTPYGPLLAHNVTRGPRSTYFAIAGIDRTSCSQCLARVNTRGSRAEGMCHIATALLVSWPTSEQVPRVQLGLALAGQPASTAGQGPCFGLVFGPRSSHAVGRAISDFFLRSFQCRELLFRQRKEAKEI